MDELNDMEGQMQHVRRQYAAGKKRQGMTFAQQIAQEQFANRVEEALACCSLQNEALIRKVYFEQRDLGTMSKEQQKRMKKAGLEQFFRCLYK